MLLGKAAYLSVKGNKSVVVPIQSYITFGSLFCINYCFHYFQWVSLKGTHVSSLQGFRTPIGHSHSIRSLG